MLVMSLSCTLAAHEYHFMQLPPISPLSALSHVPPLPLLISTLSNLRPPVLWAWICAPATHFIGARILTTLSFSTHCATLSALLLHLPSPFSVIVLFSVSLSMGLYLVFDLSAPTMCLDCGQRFNCSLTECSFLHGRLLAYQIDLTRKLPVESHLPLFPGIF